MTGIQSSPARIIDLFESPNPQNDWAIVNDSVMGGVSNSRVQETSDGHILFSGNLSLENNGGFASMRSRNTSLRLGPNSTLKLRIRGDGRTYNLDLRSNRTRMAGSFRASFQTTDGNWSDVTIPMDRFVAQSFGRSYPNVEFNPSTVTSIGVTLSDKRPGTFALEIQSVEVVNGREALEPTFTLSENPPAQLISLAIQRGVPLFNQGNPEACAAVYEIACLGIASMPDTPTDLARNLREAIAKAQREPDASQSAWTLRYALDDALARLR